MPGQMGQAALVSREGPWYPGKGAGHAPAGFLLCGVRDSWPWGSPGDREGGSGTWDSF